MNQMNPNIESNKLEIQWTELDPILVKVNSSQRKPTATSYRNRITPNESQWNPISSPKTISLLRNRSGTGGGGTGRKNEPKNKRKGRCRRGPPSSVCFVLMARFSLMDSIVSISKSIDFHGRSTGPFRSGDPSGVVFTARYVTIRKKISRNSITDAIQFHSEMPYLESQKS